MKSMVSAAFVLLCSTLDASPQQTGDSRPIVVELGRGPVMLGRPTWDRMLKASPDDNHSRNALVIPVWDKRNQQPQGTLRIWCNRSTGRLGILQFAMSPALIEMLHKHYLPFDQKGEQMALSVSAHEMKDGRFVKRGSEISIRRSEMRPVDNGIAGGLLEPHGVVIDSMLGKDGNGAFQIGLLQTTTWPDKVSSNLRIAFAFDAAVERNSIVDEFTQRGYVVANGERVFSSCAMINQMN
jgi:hypothetical protein